MSSAHPSRQRRSRHVLTAVGLMALGWGVGVGCGSDDEHPPVPDFNLDTTLPPQTLPTTGTACPEGDVRECSATLAIRNGVASCYQGLQACEGGRWGNCLGGSIVERVVPELPPESSARLLSYSSAVDCSSNPCDPYCQGFNEVPTEPLVAGEQASGYSWQTGSANNANAELALGSIEPCNSGNDCQFNQYCEDAVTSSTCAHSKCAAGSALVAACDDCASLVCASNPACCQRGWSCDHDVCDQGTKLASDCDNGNPAGSCVAKVCAKDATCCSTSWTEACVQHAQKECGVTCGACAPGEKKIGSKCYYRNATQQSWSASRTACQARGSGWDLVTIDNDSENTSVAASIDSDTWIGYSKSSGSWKWTTGSPTYTSWASSEPGSSDTCARIGTNKKWIGGTSCSPSGGYKSFCEGPAAPAAVGVSWTQTCADAVETTCDVTCGAGSPPAESGQCKAWNPGDTDPNCPNKPDLALGVPCDNTVPVCNHGGAAAPAGVTVAYYGSSAAFTCSPTATPKGTCSATTQAIPPGECVNVTCPTSGTNALSDKDRLVVNRSAAVSECSCLDNWSVYGAGVTCGAPSCQGTSSEADFKPVRMLMVVDRSYSMVCHDPGCSNTRWLGASAALKAFFENSTSAGLAVAMEMFPLAASGSDNGCAGSAATSLTDASCSATPCKTPLVPLGYLTAASGASDPQEKKLVDALNNVPNSGSASTPSHPALDGALQWAVEQQTANPNETFIVVFVTDGEPSKCLKSGDSMGSTPNTNAALIALAKTAYDNHRIRTYTLGIEGSSVQVLDQIAAAGGTTKSFVVGGTNASAIATSFTNALSSISLQSASCTLDYTASEESDPANAVVTYTSGTTTTTLTKRASSSACAGGGWYYDNEANPTHIILCPSTCTTVQASTDAKVKLDVPCAAEVAPAVYTQKYAADCPDAQYPLWQFLTYDTTNEEGGEVQLRVRTASTEAGLATATNWFTVATATRATPDCRAGERDGCPVDLYTLLGDAAGDPNLELEITVTPTTRGKTPSVNSWQVTYTCPFDQ